MASRKDQKEALRRERLEREQVDAAAARRRRLIGYVVAAILAGAAIAAIAVAVTSGGSGNGGKDGGGGKPYPKGSVPPQKVTDFAAAVKAAGCVYRHEADEGRGHVSKAVTYETNPPTSGPHDPVPADDGAYTEAPRTEQLVHTLEHGRIEIQFDPNAADSVRGTLKALFDEDPYHMVITPNGTKMPYEVAVTAWRQLLGCKRMGPGVPDAIRTFKDRFRDRGPERVP